MRPTGVSASQANEYYYAKDSFLSPEGKGENSSWFGTGARALGLEGSVQQAEFAAVNSGSDPKSGEQLVQNGYTVSKDDPRTGEKVTEKDHKAGIDLTFDAPKSVSIMGLHVGDERVLEAHRDAVQKTLQYIEKNYSYT